MIQLTIQEKAVETLFIMKRAVVHLHMYPPNHPLIINTIDKIYESFMAIFEKEDSVIFAESERNLVISGQLMSQKYRGNPYIAVFLVLMINWRIKSINFMRGLEKSEILPFLGILAKTPDDEVKMKRELEQLIAERKMPHILFHQKFYAVND
jgi:hypothetical protein